MFAQTFATAGRQLNKKLTYTSISKNLAIEEYLVALSRIFWRRGGLGEGGRVRMKVPSRNLLKIWFLEIRTETRGLLKMITLGCADKIQTTISYK